MSGSGVIRDRVEPAASLTEPVMPRKQK